MLEVLIREKVKDWKESIAIAAIPLLEKKIIQEEYVKAMIDNVLKFGFYIVIYDYVAMAHARPENGVLKSGMSLLKLDKAVKFGEEEVYLVFVLAAVDNHEHIEKLKEIAFLLEKEEVVEELINIRTVNEITEKLSKYIKED